MKRINKNVAALIVAVVLALACAILIKVLIDKKISKSLDTEKVSYVVANTDLQSGVLVDPYDQKAFAVRSDIPAQFAQSNAITPDQAESIKGSLLIANMKRGDILTWQMINTDERSQLANKLLPGRRALTIPVDDQSSISSMLKPNDHIDLILSYEKNGVIVAAPLLQNVRVIATGNNVSTNVAVNAESSDSSYANITLDLDIEEVSKVTTALDLGKLSAVLRNPEDTSYTTNVISLQTLQKELSLRNIGFQLPEPPPINDNYSKQLAAIEKAQERQSEVNLPEPQPQLDSKQEFKPVIEEKKAVEKPSINVIYGNKTELSGE